MELQRVSHTHEMVINWLVLNPEKSLRECADTFGYTQPWLSTLIHSDLFQSRLRARQEQIASRVTSSIPEKLQAITDIALDKLGDVLAKSEDPEYILDVADRALHRMGYAPASARNPAGSPSQAGSVNNQTNVFMLAPEDLHQARALMQQVGQAVQGIPTAERVLEGEVVPL